MTSSSNIKSLNRRHLLRTGLAGGLAVSLSPLLHAQDKYPLATTRSGKIRGVTEHNIH